MPDDSQHPDPLLAAAAADSELLLLVQARLVGLRCVANEHRAADLALDRVLPLRGPLPSRVDDLIAKFHAAHGVESGLRAEIADMKAAWADIASILTDAGIPTTHEELYGGPRPLTPLERVRMAVARRGLVETRDILDRAGVLPGTVPDRVQKLADASDALDAIRGLLAEADITAPVVDAVTQLLAERERAPSTLSTASWNDGRLRINGVYCGTIICISAADRWQAALAEPAGAVVDYLPNRGTAAAVLLASVGQPPGPVRMMLRPGAAWEDFERARVGGLGEHLAALLDAHMTSRELVHVVETAETIRDWIRDGQAALTISADRRTLQGTPG